MTELLRKAFEKLSEGLPDYEQDRIGRLLLDALEKDEQRWSASFVQSQSKLERLANQALEAFHVGHTEPLDPEKL